MIIVSSPARLRCLISLHLTNLIQTENEPRLTSNWGIWKKIQIKIIFAPLKILPYWGRLILTSKIPPMYLQTPTWDQFLLFILLLYVCSESMTAKSSMGFIVYLLTRFCQDFCVCLFRCTIHMHSMKNPI